MATATDIELLELEAGDGDLTPPGWDGLAAMIRRDTPDMCSTIRLWRQNDAMPEDVRHYLGEALDALSEAAYAARVQDESGSVLAHSMTEFPASWQA